MIYVLLFLSKHKIILHPYFYHYEGLQNCSILDLLVCTVTRKNINLAAY